MLLKRLVEIATCVVLCAFSSLCSAQVTFNDPPCSFRSVWLPSASGTDWVVGAVGPGATGGVRVSYRAWWCPKADGTWSPYVHKCIEGRTCLSAELIQAELTTAARSADKLAALQEAVRRYQLQPMPNEFADWNAADAAAKAALNAIKPPDRVGNDPVYVVTGKQAFPLNQDGTRSVVAIAKAPTAGETCDCTGTNKIVQFGATFCKVPSLSTTQTIVAGCSLKKP